MEKYLSGKVALVTGGSSGIGKAAALLFARQGARVAVAARRKAEVQAVVDEIKAAGGVAIGVPTDISDPAQVSAMVETVANELSGNTDVIPDIRPTQPGMGVTEWRSKEPSTFLRQSPYLTSFRSSCINASGKNAKLTLEFLRREARLQAVKLSAPGTRRTPVSVRYSAMGDGCCLQARMSMSSVGHGPEAMVAPGLS